MVCFISDRLLKLQMHGRHMLQISLKIADWRVLSGTKRWVDLVLCSHVTLS